MSTKTYIFVLLLALGVTGILSQFTPTTEMEKTLADSNKLRQFLNETFIAVGGANNRTIKIGGRTYSGYDSIISKCTSNSFSYFFRVGAYSSANINKAVTFHCRNRTTVLTSVTSSTVRNVIRLVNEPLLFAIHGWTDSKDTYYFAELLKNYFLREPSGSVCIVDWSPLSLLELFYYAEVECFRVANLTAKFIRDIVALGQSPQNIAIVGHSLGAQITGLTGIRLQDAPKIVIGKCIATDQTGPGWQARWNTTSNKFNPTACNYTQAIISNRDNLGASAGLQLGHQRFLCNAGGPLQPGCGSDKAFCPHYRGMEVFTTSLIPGCDFSGVQCNDFDSFVSGGCNGGSIDQLGLYGSRAVDGAFQVFTNYSYPWCMNEVASGDPTITSVRKARMDTWQAEKVNFGTNND